ncbi:hypothetical protein ABIB73_001424 [Bradyrhizobium sp. F1.4.3]|uniref:hypothetical protein n=1 Tax=Bradyrhizobium sp. F1.4.3 TaxID=3156356 RepID=UPI003398A2B1
MQQQNARKNYIGIVSDTTEDERVGDTAVRSRVMGYLVDRLAKVLKRRREPAPGRTITP